MNTLLSGAHSKGKKTQKRLSESGQRYRELANSLPNIIFETDMKGQVTFTNKMGYENSGCSQEEI